VKERIERDAAKRKSKVQPSQIKRKEQSAKKPKRKDRDSYDNWRALSKHYDYDSATGEANILLASIFYMSKRLTHQEQKSYIDPVIEAKLRKLTEKTEEKKCRKIAQPP